MATRNPHAPIRFYFDFSSPYAYFASTEIDGLGAEFAREVEWRPFIMWALIRENGIPAPMQVDVKRTYMVHDMERSAAFYGKPYHTPDNLPVSSHLAARLYYAIRRHHPEQARLIADTLFRTYFVERRNIGDEAVLVSVAQSCGIPEDICREALNSDEARQDLRTAVSQAVADGVVGSPFFKTDGDIGFFGADRLPQLRWFLEGKR